MNESEASGTLGEQGADRSCNSGDSSGTRASAFGAPSHPRASCPRGSRLA